jgi:hypothetical protein
MADNIIKVNVTSVKQQRVSVSNSQVGTEITASGDTGRFWAQTAKNWAVSDVIVDNTDYSSKHYALEAKESANNASNFENATRETYNSFLETSANAVTEIQGVKEETLTEIDNSKTNAVDSINSTKTTVLNDIEFVADGEKQEIQELSEETQNKIIDLGIDTRANVDLSNLSAMGEKHFLNKSQITNCLLEVPQNIKVELGDNGLILKAGSIITFPNGANNYEHYTTTRDMRLSSYGSGSDDFFVCIRGNKTSFTAYPVRITTSGPTAPTGEGLWYDTTNNLVKFYNSSGELQYSGLSLPIAICTRSSGTITGVKQVFDSIGYIGSHLFVNKGLKGLIPNGFNSDGTLNNIEFTVQNVTVSSRNLNSNDIPVWYRENGKVEFSTGLVYNDEVNKVIGSNYNYLQIATVDMVNGVISNLRVGRPFRAVDYNDIRDKIDALQGSGVGMPSSKYTELTLGATGTQYTAPANGWVSLNKVCGGSGQYINMTNKANGMSIAFVAINSNNTLACYLPVQKGQVFTVGYTASGTTNHFRFIYAEGAK